MQDKTVIIIFTIIIICLGINTLQMNNKINKLEKGDTLENSSNVWEVHMSYICKNASILADHEERIKALEN